MYVYRSWLASSHIASPVTAQSSNRWSWSKRHRLQWLVCHVRDEPHCLVVLTWCYVWLLGKPATASAALPELPIRHRSSPAHGGRRGWVPWPPSSFNHCAGVRLLVDPLTPASEIHSSARSPAPRQAVAVARRAGSAHQGCHGGSALVLDVCALSAGPVRCCWSRTVVTCQGLTALRPFPCSVLSQFCSSPINSSTPFMWKGRVSLLPLRCLFQDSVSGVTWQLWRTALNLYAVSKDSSGFGLQPSQCLQNFTVKERDTVHLVILLISLPAFLID